MKELIDSYLKDTVEFSSMLEERTASEVAYDHEVVMALRRGLSIKRALDVAGEKYPGEALKWNDGTINDIKAHYEYQRHKYYRDPLSLEFDSNGFCDGFPPFKAAQEFPIFP